MSSGLEKELSRWTDARLIDAVTASNIRRFEAARSRTADNVRWQSLLALSFGALMLIGGILLFVAAHWENMSPATRFISVLAVVAFFHVAGAFAETRFRHMAIALHGIGTGAFGAGIFLSAQIFNLEEHWPGGIMLWAVGAWIAWALRRDWVQAAYVFLLTPAWIVSEWFDATTNYAAADRVAVAGIVLLSVVYVLAPSESSTTPIRRLLMWIGGISIIPATIWLCGLMGERWSGQNLQLGWKLLLIGWTASFGLPLVFGYFLKRQDSWMLALGALWVALMCTLPNRDTGFLSYAWHSLGPFILGIIGSIALVGAGLLEKRKERINLGVAGVAISTIIFYFSNVMDKLGRSVSLIGLGILFLLGGWILERTRRKLVQRMAAGGTE